MSRKIIACFVVLLIILLLELAFIAWQFFHNPLTRQAAQTTSTITSSEEFSASVETDISPSVVDEKGDPLQVSQYTEPTIPLIPFPETETTKPGNDNQKPKETEANVSDAGNAVPDATTAVPDPTTVVPEPTAVVPEPTAAATEGKSDSESGDVNELPAIPFF